MCALRDLGHDVSVLVHHEERPWYLPQVQASKANPADFDVLYLFKVHSIRNVLPKLKIEEWPDVRVWMDFSGAHRDLLKIPGLTSVAWATAPLLKNESVHLKGSTHTVCEHGTIIPSISRRMSPIVGCGLYMGRLPKVYLDVVKHASTFEYLDVFCLKIWHEDKWIQLREGKYTTEDFEIAEKILGPKCKVYPAQNVITTSGTIKNYAFGLVPATQGSHTRQVQSACKFWDYASLGIPVVMAENVPEVVHLEDNPTLGFIYTQDGGPSLGDAINQAMIESKSPDAESHREDIREWALSQHTWKHRAKEISDAQLQ